MKFFLRFVLLLVIIVMIAIGGYWTVSSDIDRTTRDSLNGLRHLITTLDSGVLIMAFLFWVRTMGGKFLLIEVPKRLLMYFLVPYIVIWLLPTHWHRWFRRQFIGTRVIMLSFYHRFMWWLRTEVFGPFTGYALGLIMAGMFFLLFYSLFWTYLGLWLGFIRIPTPVIRFFGFVAKRIIFTIEKLPFATVVFKWGAIASEWVDDQIPQVRWTPTPESKRNRARKMARRAILLRYKRIHWFEKISLSRYRSLLSPKGQLKPKSSASSTQDSGSNYGETK